MIKVYLHKPPLQTVLFTHITTYMKLEMQPQEQTQAAQHNLYL